MGKREGDQTKEHPIRKQERKDLRCNTDPQINKTRTRRKNSTNEPGHPKDNKDDKEITHPSAAITWGRRKKRNREKQKKIARKEKKTRRGKRNTGTRGEGRPPMSKEEPYQVPLACVFLGDAPN